MKKGASHVDWAISMGIFLVYIMLMLIFLRPTSQPTYSGDTLLDIISLGIREDTTFTVHKEYFMIRPTNLGTSQDGYNIRIKEVGAYLSEEWKNSEKQGLRHLTMFDENLGKVPSQDLDGKDIAFDFTCEGGSCQTNEVVLDIRTNLENNQNNVFWFVYSEDRSYSHGTAPITYSDEACQAENPPGSRTSNCYLNDGSEGRPDDFTYEFGLVETRAGFSSDKVETLSNQPYDELKSSWNFPTDKNFKIKITSNEGVVSLDYNKDLNPEPGINVYVREEKIWFMDEKGYLTPANIVITIW